MANKKQRVAHIRSDYTHELQHMDELRRKRRIGLIRRLSAFFILMLLVIGSMVSVLDSRMEQLDAKKQNKEQLQAKLDDAKQHQTALNREIKLLHDMDYIGQLARKDYFLSDDNEIIFSSVENDNR